MSTSSNPTDPPRSALAQYWEDKRQPLLMLAAAAAVIALVMLYLAVTGEDEDTTWDAPPSVSSCRDYREVMNDAQRTDIASKMLHALRAKDALSAPSDGLVDTFANGLETACEGGANLRVDEAGATLYLTERATFGR